MVEKQRESLVDKLSPKGNNGWDQWARHVLLELERLDDNVVGVVDKVNDLHIELAQLKVKAGIWGFIGGAIPIISVLLIYIVGKLLSNTP